MGHGRNRCRERCSWVLHLSGKPKVWNRKIYKTLGEFYNDTLTFLEAWDAWHQRYKNLITRRGIPKLSIQSFEFGVKSTQNGNLGQHMPKCQSDGTANLAYPSLTRSNVHGHDMPNRDQRCFGIVALANLHEPLLPQLCPNYISIAHNPRGFWPLNLPLSELFPGSFRLREIARTKDH